MKLSIPLAALQKHRPVRQPRRPLDRAGQTVSGTDVLVKYTYAGDADLNGKLDGDDDFILDSHANATPGSSAAWVGLVERPLRLQRQDQLRRLLPSRPQHRSATGRFIARRPSGGLECRRQGR